MLFNSDQFLFEFLPAVLVGFLAIRMLMGGRAAQYWLAAGSLVFYASAGLSLLPPLLVSALTNFMIGRMLARRAAGDQRRGAILFLGVGFDLSLLGYFKYAAFIVGNLNDLGFNFAVPHISLPLGISFYTFTQIAFLVDAARGQAAEYDLPRYLLFVSFFPHLIAGPIIHHKQMMPQLTPEKLNEGKLEHAPRAIMLFAIGLAKKVLIADGFARLATPVFTAANQHAPPDLISAWGGMLAYTFQIYFDFSGYSDMALGLALLFGVTLPVNFLAPYKSESIIEFWRTWHMTLSAFLRDYLYIPLGGNRKGKVRRYINLMLTMTIGGLWHGAGWTFVLWGALHGFYLLVNHTWQLNAKPRGWSLSPRLARGLTFLAVALAWVLFRADTMHAAKAVYAGLVGLNGIKVMSNALKVFGIHHAFSVFGTVITPQQFEQTRMWLDIGAPILGLFICWVLPNSMEVCGFVPEAQTRLGRLFAFRLTPQFAILSAAILFAGIDAINSGAVSEFIYYRF
ncbi:MAG: MBOAT family protein [Alphaproteobacteria bacterium]|nr:MBOAT family protein [Alphaproteobacteria bacterium]